MEVNLPGSDFIGSLLSQRVVLYVALATSILAVCLLQSGAKTTKIDVPVYKASRWKWVFDAETLIRDSYQQVSINHYAEFNARMAHTDPSFSFKTVYTRLEALKAFRFYYRPSTSLRSRRCQKRRSAVRKPLRR